MINGAVQPGDAVLITGIGGGVALTALQLCVARGARVYVTSGSADKIRRAVELGAKGGVSYKDGASWYARYACKIRRTYFVCAEDWPKQLGALLKAHGAGPLSTVIDAGGGEILAKTSALLKQGGRVVVYGM